MVVLCLYILLLFVSCFLVFSYYASLPGDDVLCRLLSYSLPSVCFPCLSVFFVLFSPTVSVPSLVWFGSVYLVATAEFLADQLIM